MAKILIIEDNAKCLHALTEALTALGHTPTGSNNGSRGLYEALNASEEEAPFALILTDGQLPGTRGPQIIKQLRQEPAYAHIPIIASSGDSGMWSDFRADKNVHPLKKDYGTQPPDYQSTWNVPAATELVKKLLGSQPCPRE